MLFDTLDKIKRRVIMMAIVLMFVGNILLIFPEAYLSELSVIFSFILFVVSVIEVLRFLGSKHSLIHYIQLTFGLFAGLLGMIFLVYDDVLLRMLSFLVSFLPIVLGSYGVYHAFAFARRSGRRGWWSLVILSAFLLLFWSCNILFH